jgi:DNA end-binding protein Ku
VRQDELEAVAPKATRAIEIQDFVSLDEIDPVFFDRAYYVVPKPEGMRPYKLLFEALSRKKKVGIAKVVMYGKEYLAGLRPVEEALCLETMHFGDEVVPANKVAAVEEKTKVDARELKIAEQLIDSLTTDFKPEAYHDEYREAVMQMIEKKARGEKVVLRPEAEKAAPRGKDLIAALEASLEKAKGQNGHAAANGKSHARRRKSA